MDQLDVTLRRALKIWWSFVWRVWVLMMLVGIPVEVILILLIFRHLPTGTPADAAAMARMPPGLFFLAWLIVMTLMLLLQAQAVRWMLRKARWSDFRLAVLPRAP